MRSLFLISAFLFAASTVLIADGPIADAPEPAAADPIAPIAPDPSEVWRKTVETLASALAENDPGALLSVFSDDKAIYTFDGKVTDAVRLLARTRKGVLIGNFTYTFAPENMAGDISDAFKLAEIPEELKGRMQTRDETHRRRANRTAVTWLADSLQTKNGDKVGVLIFWCDRPGNGDAPELVFVLVKADPESAGAKIKTVTFGNPTPRSAK